MVDERLAKWSSVVVRNPEKYREKLIKYEERRVPFYTSYEGMLRKEKNNTAIIALPTSIMTHSTMTIAALRRGYSVIVEKPPAPTIQELDEMIAAEVASPGSVAVGFQNQSRNTVRSVKSAVVEGELGKIKEVMVKARWSRLDDYYERNPWAGKIMIKGKYVLDGPNNNALSHYLNNALYYACSLWHKMEPPVQVRSELYKAHDIESEDTSCTQVKLANGTMVYFYVTHAGRDDVGPVCEVVGTKGAAYREMNGPAIFRFEDGTRRIVEDDGRNAHDEVFRNFIRYLQGVAQEIDCTLSMTRPFVVAINGTFLSSRYVKPIPKGYITREPCQGSVKTIVENLDEIIDKAYKERKLFSDMGIPPPWARRTRWVNVEELKRFEISL